MSCVGDRDAHDDRCEEVVDCESSQPLERDPFPVWGVAAACIGNIAHFYSICSLFSYAGIMSADLGWVADRDSAGFVAGFLQTANVLGRLPTSSLWGYLADRFGMKRCICISMISMTVGNAVFAVCTKSFIVAIAVRFVFLGMGSGWVAFIGPLTMALGGPERQTEVTGHIFAVGTFIQLVGPAVGGWTYGVYPEFPAVIPGMVGAVIAALSFIAMCRWMPTFDSLSGASNAETKRNKMRTSDVVCTRPLPMIILLRSVAGFMNFTFFEVVPLWAISSLHQGGLALSENDLGIILAMSALLSGSFMALLLARVVKCLGLRLSITCGNLVIATCFLLMPFCPGYVQLTVLHASINSGYGLTIAGYISCTNNVTPHGHSATVNGIAVTFESLGKGLGPVLSAVMFADSLAEWGQRGHYYVFFGMVGIHVFLALGTASLRGVEHVSAAKSTPSPSGSLPIARSFGALGSKGVSNNAYRPGCGEDDDDNNVGGKGDVSLESFCVEEKGHVTEHGAKDIISAGTENVTTKAKAVMAVELEPLNT